MSLTKDKRPGFSGTEPTMQVVPDDCAEIDEIGYDDHVSALTQMIRSVNSRGAFTIGVYGDWGQGKTSLLQQLKGRLDRLTATSPDSFFTVWYDAWRFSSEKHQLVPFFEVLHRQLGKLLPDEESNLGASDRPSPTIRELVRKLKRVPLALAYGLEAELRIPFLTAKLHGNRLINRLGREAADGDEGKRRELLDASTYVNTYYELGDELRVAARGLEAKIVVFVDDLDRCLPEKALGLLEGIKGLLDLPGFIFVLGLDKRVVEQGIHLRYFGRLAEDSREATEMARSYLDKIVQFSFSLPPADPDRLRVHVLEAFLRDMPQVEPYMGTVLEALGDNPRTLKRFINALSFSLWLARRRQREDGTNYRTELLVKMTLMAFRLPALYSQLARYPHHVLRLQGITWSAAENRRRARPGWSLSTTNIQPSRLPKRRLRERRRDSGLTSTR